jgi:integrase/recombinase XerD
MNLTFIRHATANLDYCTLLPKLRYNKKSVELPSTGIKIHKDDWDLEKKRVLYTDPHYSFKNEQLANFEMQVMAVFNDFLRKNKPFTVYNLKEALISEGEDFTFMKVFDLWIIEIKGDSSLSDGTKKRYQHIRDCVLEFMLSKKNHNMLADDFDEKYFEMYRKYLLSEKKFSKFTVHKRCQVVKQVVRWAKKNKYMVENTLEYVSMPEPKLEKLIYLNAEQFEKLRQHTFKSKLRQEVADVFVIYCRTGFHYQDLKNVINNHTLYEQRGIDGKIWIYNERVKTGVTAKVPYFPEVVEILNKYGGWKNIPIKSNSKMNDVLKLIADELEFPALLSEKISVKAGRKTLSDFLRNEKGWGTDEIKILLGISNERYVECYSKADERKVVKALFRSGLLQAS